MLRTSCWRSRGRAGEGFDTFSWSCDFALLSSLGLGFAVWGLCFLEGVQDLSGFTPGEGFLLP